MATVYLTLAISAPVSTTAPPALCQTFHHNNMSVAF